MCLQPQRAPKDGVSAAAQRKLTVTVVDVDYLRSAYLDSHRVWRGRHIGGLEDELTALSVCQHPVTVLD